MELLLSLIAIVLSFLSILVVIAKMGLGLGLEFIERQEIRDMRKSIDEKLRLEWRMKLEQFLTSFKVKKETVDEKIMTKEISNLNEAARLTGIASAMLKVISKVGADIVKKGIVSIVLAVLLMITLWTGFAYPDLWTSPSASSTYNYSIATLMEIMFLILLVWSTRKSIRNYYGLRTRFYDLSDKPTLSQAKEIYDYLRKEEINIL